MADEFEDMTGTAEGNAYWERITELIITVLALERGGILRLTNDRVAKAMQQQKGWFPQGMHLHMETKEGNVSVDLVDASKCQHPSHAGGGQPDHVTVFDEERPTEGFSMPTDIYERLRSGPSMKGSVTFGRGDGEQHTVADVTQFTRPEMLSLLYAYHILLTCAIDRVGGVIEADEETYKRVTSRTPMGALSVSRHEDRFSAAIVSGLAGGRA